MTESQDGDFWTEDDDEGFGCNPPKAAETSQSTAATDDSGATGERHAPERPVPDEGSRTGESACWNCSARMQESDALCPSCAAGRLHAVLVCEQNRLRLTVGPGLALTIGRDPSWAPRTAPMLASHLGVSRRHATVTMERDGAVWVEEYAQKQTTNQTRIDGQVVPREGRARLRDGNRLSLGRSVHFSVRLYGTPPPTG